MKSRFKLLERTIFALPPGDRVILGRALAHAGITKSKYADPISLANRRIGFSRVAPHELRNALEYYNSHAFIEHWVDFADDLIIIMRPGHLPLKITQDTPVCLFKEELPSRGWLNRTLSPLEIFLRDNPEHHDALYMKGQIFSGLGRNDEAELIFRSLLSEGFKKAKGPLSEIIAGRGNYYASPGDLKDLGKAYGFFKEALEIMSSNRAAAEKMINLSKELSDPDLIASTLKFVSAFGLFHEAVRELSELCGEGGRIAALARNALFDIYVEAAEDAKFSKDFEAAEVFYGRAVEVGDPLVVDEKMAILYHDMGELQKSYDLFKALSEHIFLSASSLSIFGNVCLAMGRTKEAIHWFNVSFNHDPRNRGALLGKGKALLELGDLKNAVACFELVKEYLPEAAKLFTEYGRVLSLQSREDSLTAEDIEELKIDELQVLAKGLRRARFFRSLSVCCIGILRLKPDDAQAMRSLGKYYRDQKDLDAYEKLLRRILEVEPSDNESFEQLIFLLINSQREAEGNMLLSDELKKRPTARVCRVAAILCRKREDFEAALKFYEESLRLDPEDFRSRIGLINILIRDGGDDSLERALILAREGQKRAPDHYDFYKKEVGVLLKRKEYQMALTIMLEQHAKMQAKRRMDAEERDNVFWLELRIAEVYMDLKNASACGQWLRRAKGQRVHRDEKAERMIQFMESWVADMREYGRKD